MKRALLLLCLSATLAVAQAPADSPRFEAATIKRNTSGNRGGGMNIQPARIRIINSTLKFVVQMAYNVKTYQVSGATSWMDGDHYDIEAVSATAFTAKEEYRPMLQALLVERFGLTIRKEMQDRTGYVLVVAKGGAKLPPPVEDNSIMFSGTPTGDRTLSAKNITMERLASALSSALNTTVVDKTGIEGRYDASFQWTPDSSTPPLSKSGEPMPAPDPLQGPTIFTALQEKLGLKLGAKKVPVEVIVITSANRPTEN